MTDPQLPPPPGARSTPDGPPPAPPAYAPAPTAAPVPPAYDAAPVPPAYDAAPVPPAYDAAPVPPSYAAAPVPPSYGAAPVPPAYAAAPGAYPTAAPVAPAAPPGAYAVPVGGYAVPSGAYSVPDAAPQRSGVLGSLALVFSLVAAVVAPILGGISAFEIGRRLPYGVSSGNDLSVLSPARDQVLWAELSFWTGTVFGVAALVLGIIAIRRRQGRGAGIAALVLAVLGVVIFSAVVLVTFAVGGAAGFAGSPA
ncbi:hypothetical protein [Microbacterium sufflavum]